MVVQLCQAVWSWPCIFIVKTFAKDALLVLDLVHNCLLPKKKEKAFCKNDACVQQTNITEKAVLQKTFAVVCLLLIGKKILVLVT